MKSLAFACIASIGTVVNLSAGPTERAIIAAMKLSEQPNYAWSSTVDDDAGSYVIDGRTNGAGYTWVRMPMTATIARALGREAHLPLEAYFHGKNAGVVYTGDDWKTIAELPASRELRVEERKLPMVRGSASAGNFGGAAQRATTLPFVTDEKNALRGRASLQFGVSHPHEELAIIVSCAQEMETNGEIVTGRLSENGAALLFVHDDHAGVAPLAAAGVFKLWLRDGAVVKYQLRLEALVAINRKKVIARFTTNTVLHDIGSTRLAVPDEVRAKLGH